MYDDYKHLLGQAYTSGDQDCYGLARRYYKEVYDLELLNVARPTRWWDDPELSIVSDFMHADGWEDVGISLRNLVVGDGLIFSLIYGKANHVGVYVGNGLFIHHLYGRFSAEESISGKWLSRCLAVVRHPTVKKVNAARVKPTDLLELRRSLFGAKDV